MTLDGVDHLDGLVERIKGVAGCGITHLGRVERADGGLFSEVDATDLLEALGPFLSFAAGRWTAPLLPVGLDRAGKKVWERWDVSPRSSWKFRHSWFPLHHPQCLAGAFPGFLRRWADPDWREALRVAVNWYVDGNSQAVALEGGLVLCQLAFELLASVLFVEDRDTCSESEFKNLSAAEKVCMLLREVKAGPVVPTLLADLSLLAGGEGWRDGPQAITKLRNCVAHPTGANRATISRAFLHRPLPGAAVGPPLPGTGIALAL